MAKRCASTVIAPLVALPVRRATIACWPPARPATHQAPSVAGATAWTWIATDARRRRVDIVPVASIPTSRPSSSGVAWNERVTPPARSASAEPAAVHS